MDTPLESREATIERLRQLWGREPGAYWAELRKAKLSTNDVFPEHVVTQPVVLPDFDKPESGKAPSQRRKKG